MYADVLGERIAAVEAERDALEAEPEAEVDEEAAG